MRLALKIDVDTLRGTREGVPNLVTLLRKHAVNATFLFALGPDHTGRAIKRVFRPGFYGKVRRTSVVRHYGMRTLMYGTVIPGPDIGRRAADVMRAVADAGFESGVHTWDHVRWQDGVAHADADWTKQEMERACERYTDIFRTPPLTHGAAGWQMNIHALRLTQRMGLDYSSDTRGTHPFIPTWQAEIIACPQLPTTLPTLDELLNRDGITRDNIAQHILQLTEKPPESGHVFTLHAELEGGKLLPIFEQLLQGWQAQGYELVSLRQYLQGLDTVALPRHEVVMREVEGRVGTLASQGEKS